jgi:hypothetical protein
MTLSFTPPYRFYPALSGHPIIPLSREKYFLVISKRRKTGFQKPNAKHSKWYISSLYRGLLMGDPSLQSLLADAFKTMKIKT